MMPTTSLGTPKRAASLAAAHPLSIETPSSGASIFAERPEISAPDARLIWRADYDPGALSIDAIQTSAADPERLDPRNLAPWLAMAVGTDGLEHVVLSDGVHHIRLDLLSGSLAAEWPVLLRYRIEGVRNAERKILPLRRLLHLIQRRRFAKSLFPDEPSMTRQLLTLRAHDAIADGASQREIAIALFGDDRVTAQWHGRSDSLRSLVRRLVKDAASLASGGYRSLLKRP